MIREQYFEGHRLPLRVEIQVADEGPFAVIVDGDHRDVPIVGGSIEDMIEYVTQANRTIYAFARGSQFWHECLTAAPYLVTIHPCERVPTRYATAFECLVTGVFTDWILPSDIFQLHGFGVCTEDGTPRPKQVSRWMEWRKREDTELVRQGIHKAPTPVIQSFRATSRTHLTVVQ